jgi:hypothetical protein
VRGQRHAPAALYPWERPGTYCTGGWVGPRPVWTGAENLAHTGIWSLDRPARSQSLYQLRYPAHTKCNNFFINTGTQSYVPKGILKYPKCCYKFGLRMIKLMFSWFVHWLSWPPSQQTQVLSDQDNFFKSIYLHVSLNQWMKYDNTMNFHVWINIYLKAWHFGHHIHEAMNLLGLQYEVSILLNKVSWNFR